jgi:hypothetical protein
MKRLFGFGMLLLLCAAPAPFLMPPFYCPLASLADDLAFPSIFLCDVDCDMVK